MWPPRTLPIVLLLLAALVVAGCGSTVQEDSVLTVHVSLPLSGPDEPLGRAMLDGAEAALAEAGGEANGATVALESNDAAAGDAEGAWEQASVAANARLATQDSTSIAYLGDVGSDATRVSAPITNEAGLLQVSPTSLNGVLLAVPGGNDVPDDVQTTGERTLGSIMPSGLQVAVAFAEVKGGDPVGAPMNPAYGFGYEAMAVILNSIERAEDPLDRADVVAAFLATTDRDGELGTYSIGTDGAAVYEDGLPKP
jgi:hypothetical protein